MERKVILLSFLLIILISINVSAEESYGKIAQDIELYKSVRFNGAPISNATCSITAFYNETVIIPYMNMSYNSNSETFNYTITNSLTQRSGVYPYDITCCANGLCTTEKNKLILTKTGTESTIQTAFFHFSMLLIAIGLFIFCLWIFFRVDGGDEYNDYDGLVAVNWKKYPKWLMALVGYYTFIWIMYSAYNISYGYLDIDGMSKVFYSLYIYPLGFAPWFFLIFITLSIYSGVRDLYNMKEIQRFGEA